MLQRGLFDRDPRILAFERFHRLNPHVYGLFVRFANQAKSRRPRFSARTILHRIRWETMVETDDPAGFKINDHWSPFYVRMIEKDHPEFAGFFEKRGAAADTMEQNHG